MTLDVRTVAWHSSVLLTAVLAACGDDSPAAPPGVCDGALAATEAELVAEFTSEVHPLLVRPVTEGGCAACHGAEASRPFTVWADPAYTFRQLWAKGALSPTGDRTLLAMLGRRDALRMPLGGPAWTDAERAKLGALVCRLEASALPPPTCDAVDPGNVLLRRLANEEYDRTVAQALGDSSRPSSSLASDSPAFGFDNVASAQTLSLGHLERYLDAGQRLARETLLVPASVTASHEAEALPAFVVGGAKPGPGQGSPSGDHYHFQRIRSYVTPGLQLAPFPGTYTVEVVARGTSAAHFICPEPASYELCLAHQGAHDGPWVTVAKKVPARLLVTVDGKPVGAGISVAGSAEDPAKPGAFTSYSVEVPLAAGPHSVRVWLDNVIYWGREDLDVALDVDRVVWSGPLLGELPPTDEARLERFLVCDSFACRDQAIRHALETLWRRPVTADEVARYAPLVDDAAAAGESFKDGLEAVLEAALVSPHFLFRPELDPEPAVPATRPLEPHELATRLSYFLWGGPPDAALLARAAAGDLVDDDVLGAEVERMLADPRASALVERFAAQWLQLGAVAAVAPSPSAFPEFDDALRASFVGELRALFVDALEHDRPIFELVDSPRVFVDAQLAAHYGLDATGLGAAFVPVAPGKTGRGGLLATAGLLAMTSHPARTSPTKRGKWVLEQLLCRPPGAPPPSVDTTFEEEDVAMLSPKELLEKHATNPSCAGCHAPMDPLGFALEGFDPLGRARTSYPNGEPVDTTAKLPDGTELSGLESVVAAVKSDPAFPACLTKKMLIHALGTDPARFDACAVEAVERRFADGGHTLRALVRAIATSAVFRSRRPAKPGEYDDLFGGAEP